MASTRCGWSCAVTWCICRARESWIACVAGQKVPGHTHPNSEDSSAEAMHLVASEFSAVPAHHHKVKLPRTAESSIQTLAVIRAGDRGAGP